jgi:hypothetical protein
MQISVWKLRAASGLHGAPRANGVKGSLRDGVINNVQPFVATMLSRQTHPSAGESRFRHIVKG